MIVRLIEDDLLSISLSSVMGTEKASDGRLKNLPPRRLGLIQNRQGQRKEVLLLGYFLITWVSMQPVAGVEAEACRSGVASFLTWKSKVCKCQGEFGELLNTTRCSRSPSRRL